MPLFQNKEVAQNYESKAKVQMRSANFLANKVTEEISTDKSIIDLGAGTGFLSRNLPDYNILQLDNSAQMLTEAQQYGAVKQADFTNYNEKSDLVISNFAFHWARDLDRLFANIAKNTEQLMFCMPIAPSLSEYKYAIDFYTEAEVKGSVSKYFNIRDFRISGFREKYNSALDFARELKSISAYNANNNRLSKEYLKQPLEVNWQVLHINCTL